LGFVISVVVILLAFPRSLQVLHGVVSNLIGLVLSSHTRRCIPWVLSAVVCPFVVAVSVVRCSVVMYFGRSLLVEGRHAQGNGGDAAGYLCYRARQGRERRAVECVCCSMLCVCGLWTSAVLVGIDVVVLRRVGVTLRHIGVMVRHVGVILRHIGVVLRHVGVILRHVGVILRHVGVVLRHVGVVLRHVGVTLRHGVILRHVGVVLRYGGCILRNVGVILRHVGAIGR
jgi:hypothetical protein